MNNANAATIRRTTCNGFSVTIENGQLCHAGGTFTRHAGVCMADALELAEAIGMFDRAEMPSLMAAASKLAKRGPLSLWPLVKEAARLSHLAGTRPADMPRPTETITTADAFTADDLRLPQNMIRAARPGRRIERPMP